MNKIFNYVIILLSILICTVGIYFFFKKKPDITSQPLNPEVIIISAKQENFFEKGEFPARIYAKQTARVVSQVSGIVSKISFQQGSYVKKDDVLFEIDEDPFLTKITAPISGIVGISNVMEGSYISKESNHKLTTIASIDKIYVDAIVPINAINFNKIQDIILEDEKMQTTLFFQESVINSETDSIAIRGEFKNHNHQLKPGGFVTATIRLKPIKAILVPQKAVFRDVDNNLNVWILKEGNVVSAKQIQAEKIFENKWIVREGLQDGELIVYEGIQALSENIVVNPIFKQI